MKCPNCGKEVKEGAKFCVGCGTSLVEEDIEIYMDFEIDQRDIYTFAY